MAGLFASSVVALFLLLSVAVAVDYRQVISSPLICISLHPSIDLHLFPLTPSSAYLHVWLLAALVETRS